MGEGKEVGWAAAVVGRVARGDVGTDRKGGGKGALYASGVRAWQVTETGAEWELPGIVSRQQRGPCGQAERPSGERVGDSQRYMETPRRGGEVGHRGGS